MLHLLPEPAPAAKPSKNKEKKGKKDMSSLFAALGEDGEAPAGAAGSFCSAYLHRHAAESQQ